MSGPRYFVLFNPAAGRGRGAHRKDRYLQLLADALGDFDHATSSQPGDIETLTREALANNYDRIVAVGGDGTWSLVANEIIDSGRRDVSLGLLPAGTGSDFGKSLGIHYQRVDEAVLALRGDEPRLVDVGKVNGRHFLNAFGCGFDIAVIDDAAGFTRLKGGLLYQYCALRQLFRFPGLEMKIEADDLAPLRGKRLMVIVSNGRYFGGSFDIAPQSDLSDGKLDLVAIDDAGPLGRAQIFSRVRAGKHRDGELVTMKPARSIRIEFESPVRYELDGEIYHSDGTTIEIECVPAAIRVHSVF
ncbi:MAG: diacylglycerol kinase family lipid kinase [Gammaproteobacteria bacterium]|nr:diacylglycerol kinase family lipid kinase [Gammaproteobacteria bacterium]